jgi:hypothetical protein
MDPFSRRREGGGPLPEIVRPSEKTVPPGGQFAFSADAFPTGTPAVAAVIGSTVVPQVVVGTPSPTVEPRPVAEGFRSVPFRADVVIDGWSTPSLTVRGVTQRGHLHRHNGAPRQDDFAVHLLPGGRVGVVVADGVSAAPQSHIGATAAVKQAADWLLTRVGENVAGTDWAGLLKSTAWALAERAQSLFGLDAPDPVRAEQQLATTLVCAVIEPTASGGVRAHLVGVGDSGAWLLSGGDFVALLGGKSLSESGITSSAVVGLPRVPAQVRPTVIDIGVNEVLLIGTDGIGDPLGAGLGGVGNLLRELLMRPVLPSLIEFAHAVDFSREAFDDDRTLVAVWPRTPPPAPASHAGISWGS